MLMKCVLVIGENSYIGKSFAEYAKDTFDIKMVNSRNDAWKTADFNGYDSILYCAGIVHIKQRNLLIKVKP
jgi:UDP-glucose 4-epimerase